MHSASSLDRCSMTTGNAVPSASAIISPSFLMNGHILDLLRVSQQNQQLHFLTNQSLEQGPGAPLSQIEQLNDQSRRGSLINLNGNLTIQQESSPTQQRTNSSHTQSESNLFQQLTMNPPTIKRLQSAQTAAQATSPFLQISLLANNNNNNMNNNTNTTVTKSSIYPTISSSNADTEKKFPSNEGLFNLIPQLDQLQKGTNTTHFELFPQNINTHLPQIAQQSLLQQQQKQSQQQFIVHTLDASQKLAPIPHLFYNPFINVQGASQQFNQQMQDPMYLPLAQFGNEQLLLKQSQQELKQNGLLSQQQAYFNQTDQYQQLIPTQKYIQNIPSQLMQSTCLLEDDGQEEDNLPMVKDEHISADMENEQIIDNQCFDSSSSFSSSSSSLSQEPKGQVSKTLLNRRQNNMNGHINQKTTVNRTRTTSQNGALSILPKLTPQTSQGSPQSRPRSKNLAIQPKTSDEAFDQPLNNQYTQHLLKQFVEVNTIPIQQLSKYQSVLEGYSRIRFNNSLLQQEPLPNERSSEFTNNLLLLTNSIQQNSLIHQNPQLLFGQLLNPTPIISRKASEEQPPMPTLFGCSSPPVSIPRLPSMNEGNLINDVGLSMNNIGPFNLRSSLRKVQSDASELMAFQSEKQKEEILAKENRPRGVSFMSLPSTNNGFSPSRVASSRVSFLSVPTPVLQSTSTDERTLLNLYSLNVKKDIERSRQFGTAKNTSNARLNRQRAESENLNNVPTLVEQVSIGSPQSKRSKYHNLTKLFMYFLLSLFSADNMEKLNIPKQIQSELIRCVQNVKKTAKKKIKNHNLQKTDFFNHTHYNVLFLHLNKNSLKELQKKDKDIDVHKQCFGIDLREVDEQRLEYVNILKKFAYEIVINTLESPAEVDCENNPRNEYMLKALSGIRQLAQGNAIFRFQQIYTGQNTVESPK